ncbi:hypothetical protein O0L34_g13681 [Tuta absoluta]|nr:hypothetical protein O0L34_g13681 [Tuta absoluta]
MKIVVCLVLLAAICQAAEKNDPSKSRQKTEKDSNKTDKRALVEGNAGIEKRNPAFATALPSATPGIVYADSNQIETDKSSQQQVAVTPLPQLAKISDLFTGQGHHFPSAIASHLFSPVSIYQTRIPGYEVSAPVAAKLAYTEKITLQPQIAQQYAPQVFQQPQQQANFIRVAYPQPVEQQYQQLIPQQFQQANQYQQLQPPHVQHGNQQQLQARQIPPANQYQQLQTSQIPPANQYQQLQAPQIQPVPQFQQQPPPQFIQIQPYQPSSPLVYQQNPFQYQGPVQFSPQPLQYIQQQLPANIQPGIVYAREENNQKPVQRELKAAQPQPVKEKQEQTYNTQSQGAVSYASFSVGPALLQPQQQNQIQHQSQAQYQPQIQYQAQQYQLQNQQAQAQQKQQQVQSQQQYQIQRQPLPRFTQQVQQPQQIHQQIQPQIQKPEPSQSNSVNVPLKPLALSPGKEQLQSFYRPDSIFQPQVYQTQEFLPQNHYAAQQFLPAPIPTYPPVQYFGKFAQELFKSYQQH